MKGRIDSIDLLPWKITRTWRFMAQAPRFSIDDFFESNFDRKASEMPDDFVTFPRENFLDLRNYWQFNHHDHHITTYNHYYWYYNHYSCYMAMALFHPFFGRAWQVNPTLSPRNSLKRATTALGEIGVLCLRENIYWAVPVPVPTVAGMMDELRVKYFQIGPQIEGWWIFWEPGWMYSLWLTGAKRDLGCRSVHCLHRVMGIKESRQFFETCFHSHLCACYIGWFFSAHHICLQEGSLSTPSQLWQHCLNAIGDVSVECLPAASQRDLLSLLFPLHWDDSSLWPTYFWNWLKPPIGKGFQHWVVKTCCHLQSNKLGLSDTLFTPIYSYLTGLIWWLTSGCRTSHFETSFWIAWDFGVPPKETQIWDGSTPVMHYHQVAPSIKVLQQASSQPRCAIVDIEGQQSFWTLNSLCIGKFKLEKMRQWDRYYGTFGSLAESTVANSPPN